VRGSRCSIANVIFISPLHVGFAEVSAIRMPISICLGSTAALPEEGDLRDVAQRLGLFTQHS
jgi:hypothetical protein